MMRQKVTTPWKATEEFISFNQYKWWIPITQRSKVIWNYLLVIFRYWPWQEAGNLRRNFCYNLWDRFKERKHNKFQYLVSGTDCSGYRFQIVSEHSTSLCLSSLLWHKADINFLPTTPCTLLLISLDTLNVYKCYLQIDGRVGGVVWELLIRLAAEIISINISKYLKLSSLS